jgi:hypothetical protein
MVTRLRSTWLAGGGAILLVLSLSGIVAAATLAGDGGGSAVLPADPPPGATVTTQTFEDIDGNGVDDDCQDPAAVADPVAAAAALKAADLNGDGTISVSEAAQSGWTGGAHCNHGGYVSRVAHGSGDQCAAGGTTPTTTTVDACDPTETSTKDAADRPPAVCPAVVEPAPAAGAQAPADTASNAHGKAVSEVGQSDAVGGKNCNHGGAVSAAARKDHSEPHGKTATKTHGKGKGKGHGTP